MISDRYSSGLLIDIADGQQLVETAVTDVHPIVSRVDRHLGQLIAGDIAESLKPLELLIAGETFRHLCIMQDSPIVRAQSRVAHQHSDLHAVAGAAAEDLLALSLELLTALVGITSQIHHVEAGELVAQSSTHSCQRGSRHQRVRMHEGHDPAFVVGMAVGAGQPVRGPAESLHVKVSGRLAAPAAAGYRRLLRPVSFPHSLGDLFVVVSGVVVA